MTYALVILLSIVVAFLGFATEVARGNIVHVRNNREPNAGASIFPVIPFGPLLIVGIVWVVNKIYPNLGFWIFIGLFCLYLPYWWIDLRRLNTKLKLMIAEKQHRSVE